MQDINLIPQEEVQEQQKAQAVKTSTVAAIGLLIVAGIASGAISYQSYTIKNQITSLNNEIENLRKEIKSNSAVEIKSRNLDKKFTALKSVFGVQYKYSLLLEELKVRKPETLIIENLDVKTGKLNLSGTADNYVSIQGFINNLLNPSFNGGNQNLKSLFKSVSLNSVTLESSKNRIQFMITVELDQNLLK